MKTLRELSESNTLLWVHTSTHDFYGYYKGSAFEGTVGNTWLFEKENGDWKIIKTEHLVSMEPTPPKPLPTKLRQ